MPRQSRIDTPAALHHIIIRGIERRVLFRNNDDREAFLDRLGELLSLLSNHAHLLLRTGKIPIAGVMRRLLTGYAVTFNRRYRRHGHLFQNRYKSILCEEDVYLQELVRYIHLNPLRAGLVKDLRALGTYPYSGHSVLMGKKKRNWQDRDYVLRYFGEREVEARREYASFVARGVEQGRKPELVGGGLLRSVGGWKELEELREEGIRVKGDERVLGRSEFVEEVLKEAGEGFERKTLLKRIGMDLKRLQEKVGAYTGVDAKELSSGSRARSVARARAILCYLAVRRLGIACRTVGKELNISPSAVSRSVERGLEILREGNIEDKILTTQ
jgi:putative transposase